MGELVLSKVDKVYRSKKEGRSRRQIVRPDRNAG